MSSMPSSKCVRKEIHMLVPASAHRLQMTSSKDLLQEHHGMNSFQVHLSLHESSSHGIAEHWHGDGGHTPGLLPPFTMRKQQAVCRGQTAGWRQKQTQNLEFMVFD